MPHRMHTEWDTGFGTQDGTQNDPINKLNKNKTKLNEQIIPPINPPGKTGQDRSIRICISHTGRA